MAIALKIRNVGNSAGVTLPKEAMAQMNVEVGDTVYLTATPSGFRITPYEENFEEALKAFERTRKRYRNALRELAK